MKKNIAAIMIAFACLGALSACGQQQFNGTFSNGYTGAKISFSLSADKKTIKDLTFTGYWRCGGSTEQITAGPEKKIEVKDGVIQAVITEPENGGASAFRFNINGNLKGKSASGTFRMSITGLSCDTYLLKWTARSK